MKVQELTLPVRAIPPSVRCPDGMPGARVEAYYGEEAFRHMQALVRRAGDANPEEYAAIENEAFVLHELHAFFPPDEDGALGVRMMPDLQADEQRRAWGEDVESPITGHGAFHIPATAVPQTALFGTEVSMRDDPEPPAWATPAVATAPDSAAQRLADFDGETYVRALDHERLGKQLLAVGHLMSDGGWHTLAEISSATGHPEASVSARIRDLRKRKFGGHTVNRERLDSGLWRYRLVLVRFETPWATTEEESDA